MLFIYLGKRELTVSIPHNGQISEIQNIMSIVFEKWYVECFNQNERQKIFNPFVNLY